MSSTIKSGMVKILALILAILMVSSVIVTLVFAMMNDSYKSIQTTLSSPARLSLPL